MRVRSLSFSFFLITIILAAGGCRPQTSLPAAAQQHGKWTYDDLRQLDPTDAARPDLDLIAGYVRKREAEIQVRLDLLDVDTLPAIDLYLAFDVTTGGSHWLPIQSLSQIDWDTLLVIPAQGEIQAVDASLRPRNGLRLHVVRDPILDSVAIYLNANALLGGAPLDRLHIEAWTASAGSKQVADSMGPFWAGGQPPPQAQLLFAFWNTLPAYTPAQALRRWDGAHSGPLGGRHGLSNLLRMARRARIPLALLDLKNPISLAALDYIGATQEVRYLSAAGLLILPVPLPGIPGLISKEPAGQNASGWKPGDLPDWAMQELLVKTEQVGQNFGLRTGQGLFVGDEEAQFVFDNMTMRNFGGPVFLLDRLLPPLSLSTPARWQDRLVISLPLQPSPGSPQANLSGPSMEVRRSLIQAALASAASPPHRAPILALGGDFSDSVYGNPQIARAAFDWIAAHPWLHPIRPIDLQDLSPAGDFSVSTFPSAKQPYLQKELQPLQQNLQRAPDNRFTQAAWDFLLSLNAPASPASPELPKLRHAYLGQVNVLLAAARWAQNPAPQSDCTTDVDLDGQPECILASESWFTLIEPQGGYLSFAFSRLPDGSLHQVISPYSQFVVGLSDPSEWDPNRQALADPAAVPGAFVDLSYTSGLDVYSPHVQPGELILNSSNLDDVRSYRLLPDGLLFSEQTGQPHTLLLPLALDPWTRFTPGWAGRYRLSQSGAFLTWELRPGLQLVVRASASMQAASFRDSLPFMDTPENPNLDYGPGHYLPFPLAQIEIPSSGAVQVEIQLSSVR